MYFVPGLVQTRVTLPGAESETHSVKTNMDQKEELEFKSQLK